MDKEWEGEEELGGAESSVNQGFEGIDDKLTDIDARLDRVSEVHVRKLAVMEREVGWHRKEMERLESSIEEWCAD